MPNTTVNISGGPESLSQILAGDTQLKLSRQLLLRRQVQEVWRQVNGKPEVAHTKGIYTEYQDIGKKTIKLVVYLDSAMRVVDGNAQREIYLARLRDAGLQVVSLEFRLSKYARQHPQKKNGRHTESPDGKSRKKTDTTNKNPEYIKPASSEKKERCALTAEEICYAENLTSKLSGKLKKNALKAIKSSFLYS